MCVCVCNHTVFFIFRRVIRFHFFFLRSFNFFIFFITVFYSFFIRFISSSAHFSPCSLHYRNDFFLFLFTCLSCKFLLCCSFCFSSNKNRFQKLLIILIYNSNYPDSSKITSTNLTSSLCSYIDSLFNVMLYETKPTPSF